MDYEVGDVVERLNSLGTSLTLIDAMELSGSHPGFHGTIVGGDAFRMGIKVTYFDSSDDVVRVLSPEEAVLVLAAAEATMKKEEEDEGYQVGDVVVVTVEGFAPAQVQVLEKRGIIIPPSHDHGYLNERGFQGRVVDGQFALRTWGCSNSRIIRVLDPEEAAPLVAVVAERMAAVEAEQAADLAKRTSPEAKAERAAQEAAQEKEARKISTCAFVVYPFKTVHIAEGGDVVVRGVGWEGFGLCGRHFRAGQFAYSPREQGRPCHSCERHARRKGYALPEGWES